MGLRFVCVQCALHVQSVCKACVQHVLHVNCDTCTITVCLCLTEPEVLRCFVTLISEDNNFPEYLVAVMLEDVQIYHYESNSRTIVIRIPSVQTAVNDHHFNIYLEIWKLVHTTMKENMLYMMESRNITSGIHYVQVLSGCEVREDGTTDGHLTVAFDGEDFLSFDKNDLRWISAVPEAQTLRQKLENQTDMNKYLKQDLENDCPTRMEEYYQRSKSAFQRQTSLCQGGLSAELCVTVLPSPGRPDVSVSYRRDVGGRALLSCLVTGFYPRPIEVTWTRDGNTVHEVESSGVLPNHDHTFQTVKQMELETGSAGEQGFSCLVEHSSLQGVLEVPWDGKTGRTPAGSTSWILGLIIGALLVSGIVGILFWKRKRKKKDEWHCRGNRLSERIIELYSTEGGHSTRDSPVQPSIQ
ncbi:major histocompatibility complex class I-related gene protein-like [Callorhinchus milii]|uniref:major histocompatibility complex class I-related gene protein-like n=1 Tax=Callorhinchus milii TaxID=7868 RepID=UPI001C3FA23B|nr:major histocompatibility complex class I-related gene protein-like [Callorhinchus milii]